LASVLSGTFSFKSYSVRERMVWSVKAIDMRNVICDYEVNMTRSDWSVKIVKYYHCQFLGQTVVKIFGRKMHNYQHFV